MLGTDFSRRPEKWFSLQRAEEVSHLAVVQAVALLPVGQVVLVVVQLFFETLWTDMMELIYQYYYYYWGTYWL